MYEEDNSPNILSKSSKTKIEFFKTLNDNFLKKKNEKDNILNADSVCYKNKFGDKQEKLTSELYNDRIAFASKSSSGLLVDNMKFLKVLKSTEDNKVLKKVKLKHLKGKKTKSYPSVENTNFNHLIYNHELNEAPVESKRLIYLREL